jgi:hypothetical protein
MTVDATIKFCEGCGGTFISKDPRKQKCKKDCGRSFVGRKQTDQSRNGARKLRTDAHLLNFVGVDGEGVNNADGSHDYILLSVGDQSLYNEDRSRLHWEQILEFMWNHYVEHHTENPVYIGFFLGYDFTQWLRTLPEKRARALLHKEEIEKRKRNDSGGNPVPYPVRLYGDKCKWEIDILGAKRFKLRPSARNKEDRQPWLYVCDTGSFWQKSLLSAINPKEWGGNPVASDEEHAIIVQGKAHRACKPGDCKVPEVPGCTAGPDALPAMIEYNITENAVLTKLTERLNAGFVQAGIRLNRDQWYGPGQAASAWLDLIGAPTSKQVQEAVPEWALEGARAAYYGGWFETMMHGHVPNGTYEYDINSAYPYIISQLPCLLHGKWTHGKGRRKKVLPEGHLRLVYAKVIGDSEVTGAMPHRLYDGAICRPNQTVGWFWWHELMASRAAGFIRGLEHGEWGEFAGIQIYEWIEYAPCKCDPPLGAVAELYQQRLAIGKKTAQGVALKFMYNSAYGKMAQSIGQPKYANAVYASLITAGCRTMILEAIATHPTKAASLVMVATDGVYFRQPHTGLDIDKDRLGAWDEDVKQHLTLMMPGIYWDDESRRRIRLGEAPSLKSRGISAMDLGKRVAEIDQQWHDFYDYLMGIPGDTEIDVDRWPSLELPIGFAMISAKQAVMRGAWDTAGQVTSESSHVITSRPIHKRIAVYRDNLTIDDGAIRSVPWDIPMGHYRDRLESFPYDKTFGVDLEAKHNEIPIAQDGPVATDLYAWIFRNED